MALCLAGRDPRLRGGRLYVKARRDGHVVAVAVIPGSSPRTAVAVNGDGRREVLGLSIGVSEAETPELVEGLDRLPAHARQAGPARRQARHLGCP